ncbi:MAG: tRNA uridine-5-carboxymethylaminomethyl(34) synthesis GTPase MnmE [Alphaproteobacteria bacterium]|nr:tRNA uridine-5-carboxymethylaminomethyl(34) synthesis GTPase MnmE [Alphaproteobacteria bacterium]MDP6517475.1 tRNA uridine-5-carboxymethylaminomethyl(34) synthesis GTPase MnmE [Alphaproteobacteria bacterium]
MDTIFAEATALGRAGVAMVRVSGPRAGPALAALGGALPPPRRAMLLRLRDPRDQTPLDDGLALWFPAPASFTGEDVAELHVHGGRAVVAGVLDALAAVADLRPAEPGEFSRRAFTNGKLDLTAAEGLADLVAAETEAQRAQALRQLEGALGTLYDRWREALIGALAHVEADLDFADEDLPESLTASVRSLVAETAAEIEAHLDDGRRGERLRDGVSIAIIGPPNAGKSSLLNHLAGRDVAIVHETAGTTRDVIEVHLNLGGFPVTMADTAGIREAGAAVEAEGVRRAVGRAGAADLQIGLFDATTLPDLDHQTLAILARNTPIVLNKIDLVDDKIPAIIADHQALAISCLTGAGIADLVAHLGGLISDMVGSGGGAPLTRPRHRAALGDCLEALGRFAAATAPELAAEDLRSATRALGRITGRVDVEDILDRIFSEFCIGK